MTITNSASGNAGPNPALASIVPVSGGMRLRWDEITTRPYQIQFRDDLATGMWQTFSGTIVSDANGILEFTDFVQPMPARRFYRTILAPQRTCRVLKTVAVASAPSGS